jgi:hypothetical protein
MHAAVAEDMLLLYGSSDISMLTRLCDGLHRLWFIRSYDRFSLLFLPNAYLVPTPNIRSSAVLY